MRTIIFQFFLRPIVVLVVIFSLSCNKSNPVANDKPQLTASESPVAMVVHWQKYITISGGQGSCSVKSVSDSSVVSASVDRFGYPFGRSLALFGNSVGTAKVIIQDSARTAELELSVIVSEMAASPSSVTVQVQRYAYVSLQGGTYPYTIDEPANSSVATAIVSGYNLDIHGVSSGSTTVVVRDNATPPHKATISITVIPRPTLTTAGTMSFSSSVGAFSANGILPEDVIAMPANSEGAGGRIYPAPPMYNIGTIVGYKKKSQNIIDLVAIFYTKSALLPGSLPIDSSLYFLGTDTALVQFVFGGDLNSPTADTYLLHSGIVTFTSLNAQHATGSFSGEATLIRNNLPVAGNTATVTNGAFDVPLLQDDLGLDSPSLEQQKITRFVQEIIQSNLAKIQAARQK